jgi:hypothetical protein
MLDKNVADATTSVTDDTDQKETTMTTEITPTTKISDLDWEEHHTQLEAMTGIDYGCDGDCIDETSWDWWASHDMTVAEAVEDEIGLCDDMAMELGRTVPLTIDIYPTGAAANFVGRNQERLMLVEQACGHYRTTIYAEPVAERGARLLDQLADYGAQVEVLLSRFVGTPGDAAVELRSESENA